MVCQAIRRRPLFFGDHAIEFVYGFGDRDSGSFELAFGGIAPAYAYTGNTCLLRSGSIIFGIADKGRCLRSDLRQIT